MRPSNYGIAEVGRAVGPTELDANAGHEEALRSALSDQLTRQLQRREEIIVQLSDG